MVAGVNWGGRYYGLDLTQPRVEDFVRDTIARARDWGFTYLKLDFVFGGALIAAADGARPGEAAYRSAMQAIREVVGDDGYLLACGAPVVPSIGVADAIRIGPDVAPHWEIDARPSDATYAEPAARHAVSTSLGRLWLWPVIAVDPDVVFFRRRDCRLSAEQKSYVRDMATICGYVGTSDPPGWLGPGERRALTDYLRQDPEIRRLDRYRFSIDGRQADFSPVVLDDPGAVRLGLAMPADPHLPWGSR
jgi:alpha-galactosidase